MIALDGRPVGAREQRAYVLLHKPRGYVTSRHDPAGRPVVVDLLPTGSPRLFPVGRLDYDAEGLLLLTNDGDLANRLLHPRYEILRVYEVESESDDSPLDHVDNAEARFGSYRLLASSGKFRFLHPTRARED